VRLTRTSPQADWFWCWLGRSGPSRCARSWKRRNSCSHCKEIRVEPNGHLFVADKALGPVLRLGPAMGPAPALRLELIASLTGSWPGTQGPNINRIDLEMIPTSGNWALTRCGQEEAAEGCPRDVTGRGAIDGQLFLELASKKVVV